MVLQRAGWLLKLKNLVARSLCAPPIGRVIRLGGSQQHLSGVKIDLDGEHLTPQVIARLKWKLYERAELSLVDNELRPDLDVIEIGASLGVVSVHIARRIGSSQRLVCVEANPELIDPLRRTLERNGVRAEVEHAAVAYGSAEIGFAVDSQTNAGHIGGSGDALVRATTLERLRAEHGIDRFALVADIEGAEIQILENDAPSLMFCDQILIELHATFDKDGNRVSIDDLERRIGNLGFSLKAGSPPVLAFERV